MRFCRGVGDHETTAPARGCRVPVCLLALCLALAQPCGGGTTKITLFHDDFQDGVAGGWDLASGWSVQLEDGTNYVLNGTDHRWAVPVVGDDWTDYELTARVKLISGNLHVVCRMTNKRGRFFIGIHPGGMYLEKEAPWGNFNSVAATNMPVAQDAWHTVRVLAVQGFLQVYLDEELRLKSVEDERALGGALLFGKVAFESLDSAHVRIDDVLVQSLPAPPAGFAWHRTGGPSGGLGYDVRIHPTDKRIMFVTDDPSGVNKSYDGGQTWVQRNTGIKARTGPSLDGLPVFSLTIDPGNPDIVWAGTQIARGVYRSADGGETWEERMNGISDAGNFHVRNFGVHPHDSATVFLGVEIGTGTLGLQFDMTKGRIFKTEDSGENWRCVWEGDSLARFVLFDQDNPHVMYASTGIFDREAWNTNGVGVLKSIDGGESWFPVNTGLENLFIGFLEMHPTDSLTLFAAAGNNAYRTGSGIYRTVNGGGTWVKVLASQHSMTAVAVSVTDPSVVYAGGEVAFYRSDDGGDTWQKLWKPTGGEWGPPGIRAGIPISVVVDPDDPMKVFANNYNGGNFVSTNGAQSWTDASRGYTGASLWDVSVDPSQPARVYTIGRSGPFRSFTGGNDWEGLSYTNASQPEWYAVAVNPTNASEVLISDEFNGVIYKSENQGNSWREVFDHPQADWTNPQETRHGFKAIAFAPSDPRIVYAGMRKGRRSIDGDFPARPSFGVYKSMDTGETWTQATNGLVSSLLNIHCVAVHPTDPGTVYVGTWKDGVFKTSDGGSNWVMKANGLVASDVRALAVHPTTPDTLYAGLAEGGGVFKSTNGGDLWVECNTGIPIECPSSLLPVGKVKVGYFLSEPEIVRSSDYYTVPWTWVWSIAIDPAAPETVYAADHYSGVYMSTNGGQWWVAINEGLTTRAVTDLAMSADGSVLYASTWGGGVFRYSPDTDGDGLADFDEGLAGTDRNDPDTDDDGMADGSEIIADTCPTNSDSFLAITSVGATGSATRVMWRGGRAAWQYVERGHDLDSAPGLWRVVSTQEPPTPVENWMLDDETTNLIRFYRIRATRP